MSILLKGLNMPKENELLCINIYPDGNVCINMDLKCTPVGEAIELLPHGRLIDADEVDKAANMAIDLAFTSNTKVQAAIAVASVIHEAPTIIPASEEGE